MERLSSSMKRTPSRPSTFAISWGSETMVVVPWTNSSGASLEGGSILLSICKCPSIRPGATHFPFRSTSSFPWYSVPMPTMIPSKKATSPFWISPEKTLTIFPSFRTRSAGTSPLAARILSFKASIEPLMMLNSLPWRPVPPPTRNHSYSYLPSNCSAT